MTYFRYGVQSCAVGHAMNHIDYITRRGFHAQRADLIYTEHGNMPAWAPTPGDFWRAADKHERSNGVALRQITVSLPNMMSTSEIVSLAREITWMLAGGKPFQMAVHMPNAALGDEPNPHVHIAISDRVPDGIERSAEQFFARYNAMAPERGGRRKDSGGLTPTELRSHVLWERNAVAAITNRTLETLGYAERVDARSLREQGVSRAPERHLGQAVIRAMTPEQRMEIRDRRLTH